MDEPQNDQVKKQGLQLEARVWGTPQSSGLTRGLFGLYLPSPRENSCPGFFPTCKGVGQGLWDLV